MPIETAYTPTEYLPESHRHACFGENCRQAGREEFGSIWYHEDADCRYPFLYDCPECDGAPTDWKLVTEEPIVTHLRVQE